MPQIARGKFWNKYLGKYCQRKLLKKVGISLKGKSKSANWKALKGKVDLCSKNLLWVPSSGEAIRVWRTIGHGIGMLRKLI